jgi:thioredoxin reductase (NADPH)
VTEPQALEETPDLHGAFPRLSSAQIAALEPHGERRQVEAGEILFREGDERYDFFVILEGKVAAVAAHGLQDEQVMAVHGPGRFLGELSLLTGQGAFFTAIVREPGEVLVVPVERLRRLVTQDAELGDLVLRAYLVRREMLIGFGAGFKVVGSRFSPDSRRLRDFLARNRFPHRWIDLEHDRTAEVLVRELGVTPEETPVVIWGDRILRNPSNAELAAAIGLRPPGPGAYVCDLLVVGAGPAGLAASVYGASEGFDTVVVDAVATGGQAATSSKIENYLGFPAGISGAELAERAFIQAEKFGARIAVPAAATALEERDSSYAVRFDDGSQVQALTVLVATGARYCRLDVPRLEEFEGTSVYYAATLTEALTCTGDPVAVVGGGNSAGQATMFLSKHAVRVHLLIRGDDLGESMSRYLVDQIRSNPLVEVMPHTEVRELVGSDGALEALVVEDNRTGERSTLESRALFVFIGAMPHTGWLGGRVAKDAKGFILTGDDAATDGHQPLPLETSLPGVFAAGDVRSGSIKRVASAVGEGAMAIRLVYEPLACAPGGAAYVRGHDHVDDRTLRHPDERAAGAAPR